MPFDTALQILHAHKQAGVQFSLSQLVTVICSTLQIVLLDAAKHDQYVLDVAAGVAARGDAAWQDMQLDTTHDGRVCLHGYSHCTFAFTQHARFHMLTTSVLF